MLLATVLDGSEERYTFSSSDPRAMPIYARAGMRPRWPLLYLHGPAPEIAAESLEALAVEPAEADDVRCGRAVRDRCRSGCRASLLGPPARGDRGRHTDRRRRGRCRQLRGAGMAKRGSSTSHSLPRPMPGRSWRRSAPSPARPPFGRSCRDRSPCSSGCSIAASWWTTSTRSCRRTPTRCRRRWQSSTRASADGRARTTAAPLRPKPPDPVSEVLWEPMQLLFLDRRSVDRLLLIAGVVVLCMAAFLYVVVPEGRVVFVVRRKPTFSKRDIVAIGLALVGLASLLSRSHMTAATPRRRARLRRGVTRLAVEGPPVPGRRWSRSCAALTASTRTTGWRSSRRSSDSPSSCPGRGDTPPFAPDRDPLPMGTLSSTRGTAPSRAGASRGTRPGPPRPRRSCRRDASPRRRTAAGRRVRRRSG